MLKLLKLLLCLLLLITLAWGFVLLRDSHTAEPLHNVYWPFTVEIQIRDR